MRLAMLWPALNGYTAASFRAAIDLGHEIYVAHCASSRQAPFDDQQFAWIRNRYVYEDSANVDRLLADLESFRPDAILASSWHRADFRAVLHAWRGRALRILIMDNPWRGTLRQWGGRAVSRIHVRPYFDAVFLPGERQAVFARMLGFAEEEIWQGAYVADADAFDRGPRTGRPSEPSFLITARLVPAKGIGDLIKAWRQVTADPTWAWTLRVAGVGPLADELQALDRVEMLGFVQPADLPETYHRAAAMVLPSRLEHWGVVVNEACAAGLPVLTTTAVGASPHLIRDGVNGWLVPPARPGLLADRMRAMATADGLSWQEMSDASRALASSYTPTGWARYLTQQCARFGAGQ